MSATIALGAPGLLCNRRDHEAAVSHIFGWPYTIRLRACRGTKATSDRAILTALPPDDRRQVAAAAGATLAELQTLTWPFSGGFDVDTVEASPHAGRLYHRNPC